MPSLKIKIVIVFLFIFTLGCQSTRSFSIKTFHVEDQNFQVVQVNSNRIQQKCLFLDAEAENNWRHQYLMFVLNDKNESLEIAHSLNMDKETCEEYVVKIENILRSDFSVKLCARDELKKKNSRDGSWQDKADFGPLGAHRVAYESLTFDTICNSKKCYGDNSSWTYTCPGFVKQ